MKEFAADNRLEDKSPNTPLPPGNSALFAAAKKKPEPDLNRMMDSYGNALLRLCFMYLKDLHLAEDAVQESFYKAYKNYHQFDGGDGEKAWINRIAVNVCKDMLRSAWKRRVSVVEELNDVPDENQPYASADTTLVEEVMRLKPRYKEVILLYYYQDLKIGDIASVLNAPESTVAVRLKRAREILKKRLGGWYYGDEA